MDNFLALEDQSKKTLSHLKRWGIVFSLLVIFLVGLVFVWHFLSKEKLRDIRLLETQLNLSSDKVVDHLNQWIENQYTLLSSLSNNLSLQLYLSEIQNQENDASEDEALTAYLKNLLLATAETGGFYEKSKPTDAINANIKKPGLSGLLLLDAKKNSIVSTRSFPLLVEELKTFIAQTEDKRRFLGPFYTKDNDALIAFIMPIYAIQLEKQKNNIVGYVLGVKPLSTIPIEQPKNEGEEVVLVKKHKNTVWYLFSKKNADFSKRQQFSADQTDLAGSFATKNPGEFAIINDYQYQKVLAVSRPLNETSWIVVYKINYDIALSSSFKRVNWLLFTYVIISLLIVSLILVFWYHASAIRAKALAFKYKLQADSKKHQADLLSALLNHQPHVIFMLDNKGNCVFANKAAQKRTEMSCEEMVGKPLVALLGHDEAQKYMDIDSEVLKTDTKQSFVHTLPSGENLLVLQSEHIPIHNALDAGESAILVVEDDITDIVKASQHHEEMLEQLLNRLVTIADSRDTHTMVHSVYVAELSKIIAEAMHLDTKLVETVGLCGRLMNIGKVLVKRSTLLHKGTLSEEKVASIREILQSSAALFDGIEYEGPVVETLEHAQECWDGSGVLGVKREEIPLTSRIIIVANKFIALVSDRAWRKAFTIDEALEILFSEAGKAVDRAVVIALGNYLDNEGGREYWSKKLKKH